MKKYLFALSSLLLTGYHAQAQNFLDFYYKGSVVSSVKVSDIDSMVIGTNSSNRTIDLYKNGDIFHTTTTAKVDSVKVYNLENALSKQLADVNLILLYGQSLSVGSDTQPAISTQNKYKCNLMLGNKVVHRAQSAETLAAYNLKGLKEVNVETPASGCAEGLVGVIQQEFGISAFSTLWDSKKFVFVSCGKGSSSIASLSSGTLFEGLTNVIDRIHNICVSENKTFKVPAFIWIQGETDQKYAMPFSTYKTSLENLRTSIDSYVKSVNNQTEEVKCVCYQTCSSNTVFGTGGSGINDLKITHSNALLKMAVPTAQMVLVRDNTNFMAAAPTYCLDHNISGISESPANIHLTNVGSKMLGSYASIAIKRILFEESDYDGCEPISYSVVGNDIIIKYKVSVKPLRIDTTFVKEVEHYGYKVINSSDNDIVESVECFDDTVTIHCTENPIGAVAVYGYNGDDGYDGRIKGGRGNICDSAGSLYNIEINESNYLLNNYAYCCAFDIVAGSDVVIKQ